jgi:hypothetical protein
MPGCLPAVLLEHPLALAPTLRSPAIHLECFRMQPVPAPISHLQDSGLGERIYIDADAGAAPARWQLLYLLWLMLYRKRVALSFRVLGISVTGTSRFFRNEGLLLHCPSAKINRR